MPRYVVERDIPGAGGWSAEQMRTVADKSRAVGPVRLRRV
jgi:hypothetical protein